MTIGKYVESKNRWRALFDKPELDLSNPRDRQEIAAMIDAELSPENLTCDGELSPADVRRRYNHLVSVARDLHKLDPRVVFQELVI